MNSLGPVFRALVESSREATSLRDYYGLVLSQMQPLLGFDTAIVFPARMPEQPPLYYGANLELEARTQQFISHYRRYNLVPERARQLALASEAISDDEAYADLDVRRETDPFTNEILRPSAIRSIMVVALRFGANNQAFLSLHRHGKQQFSANHVAIGAQVAPLLGCAISGLKARLSRRDPERLEEVLTPRERQVAACVRRGLSNKEIALGLGTSMNTVRNQVASIFEKLSIDSRAKLIALSSSHESDE